MTRGRKELGRCGEAEAAAFLRAAGLQVLVSNYRCPLGEIDLICQEGEWLVFVEVKTRQGSHYGLPREAVDGRKQVQLVRCAQYFLNFRGWWGRPCRFDVVSVWPAVAPGEPWRCEHLRDAFRLS